MKAWKTKTSKVVDILSDNLRSDLQYQLRAKVFELIRSDIEQQIKEAANELITRIDSFNEIDGTVIVNVHVNQSQENECNESMPSENGNTPYKSALANFHIKKIYQDLFADTRDFDFLEFARAIEKAHGIG